MKRLKHLKLDQQLIILFSVTIAMILLFVIGTTALFLNKYTKVLHDDLLEETHHYIETSIMAISDQMASLTLSHAFWSELVTATEKEDSAWIHVNATKYLLENDTYNVSELVLKNTHTGYTERYGVLPQSIYDSIQSITPEETQLDSPTVYLVQYNNHLYVLSLLALSNTAHDKYEGYMVIGSQIDEALFKNTISSFEHKTLLSVSLVLSNTSQIMNLSETDLMSWIHSKLQISLSQIKLIDNVTKNADYLVVFILSIVLTGLFILFVMLLTLSGNFEKSIQSIKGITYHNYRQKLQLDYSKDFTELSNCINDLAYALEERDEKIQKNYIELISILIKTLEEVDVYTRGHSERVSHYSVELAKAIGFPDLEVIRLSGLLHDVGKITVDTKILNKPSHLTQEEYLEVQQHPVTAYKILDLSELFQPIKAIVKSHHEKMDGTGYPDGLMGNEIPVGARIVAIADAFDALTSARSYRSPLSIKEALSIIEHAAGHQFDAEMVAAFLPIAERMYADWSRLTAAPSLDELQVFNDGHKPS